MKYLLDTNTLSVVIKKFPKRNDLYVLDDVVNEWITLPRDINKIRSAGIEILDISRKHLESLKRVMAEHGDNFELIRLYTDTGTADVVIIAYVLAEKEHPSDLFSNYVIVTRDKELTKVANSYGLKCVDKIT